MLLHKVELIYIHQLQLEIAVWLCAETLPSAEKT